MLTLSSMNLKMWSCHELRSMQSPWPMLSIRVRVSAELLLEGPCLVMVYSSKFLVDYFSAKSL